MTGSKSNSMKSPGLKASNCSTVAGAWPNSATNSTWASWIWCFSRFTQRRSGSVESPCVVEYSTSRIGSKVAYGMQKYTLPLVSPISSVNEVETTISLGVAILANWGCISER